MNCQEWDEWKERARENPWKYEQDDYFNFDDELDAWDDEEYEYSSRM